MACTRAQTAGQRALPILKGTDLRASGHASETVRESKQPGAPSVVTSVQLHPVRRRRHQDKRRLFRAEVASACTRPDTQAKPSQVPNDSGHLLHDL
ncbi:hypothetical protein TgHK011_001255 [Trichoderma gracile]|nr:hypothetical protein TgHK011_001255 [Trichoderma gracile]